MAKKIAVLPESKPFEPVHVLANEMAETLAVIRPFFVWPVLVGMAITLRQFWPINPFVIGFLALSAIMLPIMMWAMDKQKYMPYYVHSVITGLLVAGMLATIDVLGYAGHKYLGLFILLFGIPLICITWSIRGVIHEKALASNNQLTGVFEAAGMPNTSLKLHPQPMLPKEKKVKTKKSWKLRIDGESKPPKKETPIEPEKEEMENGRTRRPKLDKIQKGIIQMPPGATHDDLVDNVRRVESAGGFPPGTITLAPSLDHAGASEATFSDPRTIRNPVFYPGPSFAGEGISIADPLSIGMYQDSTECEFQLPGTMMQLMGQIGSGKSLGGGWSILSEAMTRPDCVIWGADVTKGYQTLGPMAPALHRMETTPKGTKLMLEDVNALIKPRTNYLAEHGFGKWQRGCGLNYMIVWLEEIPEIVADIGADGKGLWVKSVKAGRSAGITIVWSLQRSDFSQMPTIARGQAVKMCFGVADQKEAKFGLSSAQVGAGCTPELWGQRQPGMAYLDAPSVKQDKVAMPMRTWYWGEDDSLIKAHSAKYTIDQRPYDPLMQEVLGVKKANPVVMEATPTIVEPMDTGEARMKMRSWILSKRGQHITNAEILVEVEKCGYKKGWMYKVMREFALEELCYRESEGHWFVNP
jgi:hypothetical protein